MGIVVELVIVGVDVNLRDKLLVIVMCKEDILILIEEIKDCGDYVYIVD